MISGFRSHPSALLAFALRSLSLSHIPHVPKVIKDVPKCDRPSEEERVKRQK
jgi:hypothetical protein